MFIVRVETISASRASNVQARVRLVTLRQLVADYVAHVDDHLKFIHGKRANLGRTRN